MPGAHGGPLLYLTVQTGYLTPSTGSAAAGDRHGYGRGHHPADADAAVDAARQYVNTIRVGIRQHSGAICIVSNSDLMNAAAAAG